MKLGKALWYLKIIILIVALFSLWFFPRLVWNFMGKSTVVAKVNRERDEFHENQDLTNKQRMMAEATINNISEVISSEESPLRSLSYLGWKNTRSVVSLWLFPKRTGDFLDESVMGGQLDLGRGEISRVLSSDKNTVKRRSKDILSGCSSTTNVTIGVASVK